MRGHHTQNLFCKTPTMFAARQTHCMVLLLLLNSQQNLLSLESSPRGIPAGYFYFFVKNHLGYITGFIKWLLTDANSTYFNWLLRGIRNQNQKKFHSSLEGVISLTDSFN